MARIQIINPQGKSGTIDDRELQIALSSGYTMPSQPTQQKGFLENLIGSLIAPFKRTGERVIGAGQEIGLNRAGSVDEAEQLIKEAQKRMMAGDTSPEVKMMLDRAEQLSKGAQRETVASRNQEVLTDPLQIAKDSAAILSYGIPGGAGTKSATAFGKTLTPAMGMAGRSALTGAMSGGGYSQKTNIEGILGDILKGGAIGYGTGKVGEYLGNRKIGKLNKATEGADEITGGDLRRFNKQKKLYTGGLKTSDPNYLKKAIENQKNVQAITKPGSDTLDKLADLINQKSALEQKLGVQLNTSTNTIGAEDLNTFIKSYVTEGVNPSLLDETILQQQLDNIVNKSSGGQVTSKLLNDIRTELPGISQAYSKVGAGASANVPAQATTTKIERALKLAIDQLDPNAGKTISEMAPIIKGLKSMSPNVTSSIRFPILGDVTLAKRPLERVGDLITRGDAAVSGVTSNVGKVAQSSGAVSTIAPNILQQLSKQTSITPAIVGSLLGKEQVPPATQPTMGAGITQPTVGTGAGTNQVDEILGMFGLDQQSLAILSALPVKQQNAILTELIGKKITSGGEKGGSIQLISDAATQAYQALSSGDVKTGMVGGRAEKVKSQLGLGGDQPTLDFNVAVQNIFSAIAKARGGTALTESEKELLREYLPRTGDSKQMLETKLRYIIQNPEVVVLGK